MKNQIFPSIVDKFDKQMCEKFGKLRQATNNYKLFWACNQDAFMSFCSILVNYDYEVKQTNEKDVLKQLVRLYNQLTNI
jgi:hypothetical protein